MKKVYLATSISTRVDGDGRVHLHYKEHIEAILKALKAGNLDVFCAVEEQGWKISTDYTPGQAVTYDLSEIKASDYVLAVLHEDASWGVQYEMGYGAGIGKTVVIATEPADKLAYFNSGLVESKAIKHIVYKNAADLAHQFAKISDSME